MHFEELMTGPIVGSLTGTRDGEKGSEGEKEQEAAVADERGGEGRVDTPKEEKQDSGATGSTLSFAHITQVNVWHHYVIEDWS